jgi:collagenase-like PrtC family protease
MKILVELNNLSFCDYKDIDGLIVNTKYSISPNPLYDSDLIKKITDWIKDNKKELIFRIDKIIDEDNIDEVIGFINNYINFDFVKFIFTDFSIYHYFKKLNKLNKLYYFAQTYLCSSKDLEFFVKQGISCLMSNELSLDEINQNMKVGKVGLLAYGYFPIFYTKREVLSLYNEYIKDKDGYIDLKKNHVYDLIEELRDDLYKIYEGEDYSVIYSSKKMLALGVDLLKCDFIYLSNFFIDSCENKKMIDAFVKYRDGKIKDLSEVFDVNDYFTSFLYKKNLILQGGE